MTKEGGGGGQRGPIALQGALQGRGLMLRRQRAAGPGLEGAGLPGRGRRRGRSNRRLATLPWG